MANGKITLGKQSGGTLGLVFPDGVSNTEVVLPESGNIASVATAVTDNAIARYDGTTGKLQNSGVAIDDNGNVVIGGSTATFSSDISRGISIESPGLYADTEFRVNGSGSWFTSFSHNTSGAGYGGWRHIDSSGQTKNWVYTAGQGEIQFGTDGAERMRVTPSGNLLVGTTTDKGSKLQVSDRNTTLSVSPHLNGVDISSTGNFAPHYITDFTVYRGVPGSGIGNLRIAPITGNLLVGTLTDNGVDKLQVNGSITSKSSQWKYNDLNNACTVNENTLVTNNCLNIPVNDYGYVTIQVSTPYTFCMQTFVGFNAPTRMFIRVLAGGNWSPWDEK